MSKYREEHPELFDAEDFEYWKREWGGMPEYKQELLTPFKSLTFHFRNAQDVADFAALLNMRLSAGRSFWFPADESGPKQKFRYIESPERPANESP